MDLTVNEIKTMKSGKLKVGMSGTLLDADGIDVEVSLSAKGNSLDAIASTLGIDKIEYNAPVVVEASDAAE